jgi:hypothetical protein
MILLTHLGCLQEVSVDFLSSNSPEFAEMPRMFAGRECRIFCLLIHLNLLIHLGCLQRVSVDFLSSDSPKFADMPWMLAAGEC